MSWTHDLSAPAAIEGHISGQTVQVIGGRFMP